MAHLTRMMVLGFNSHMMFSHVNILVNNFKNIFLSINYFFKRQDNLLYKGLNLLPI